MWFLWQSVNFQSLREHTNLLVGTSDAVFTKCNWEAPWGPGVVMEGTRWTQAASREVMHGSPTTFLGWGLPCRPAAPWREVAGAEPSSASSGNKKQQVLLNQEQALPWFHVGPDWGTSTGFQWPARSSPKARAQHTSHTHFMCSHGSHGGSRMGPAR